MMFTVSSGPELVIGLVGAIGTDLTSVSESLQRHLNGVAYSSSEIRVSHLLHDIEAYQDLGTIHDREQYYEKHMDAGNDLCTRLERSDAMALLAVLQLRTNRDDHNAGNGAELENGQKSHGVRSFQT